MTNKFASRLEIWTGGQRLGILRDAKEVRVNETLNGQYYVTFAYPRLPDDHERYAALYEDNEVRFPADMSDRVAGQIFVIKRVEEIRRGRSVYKVVEAHHVAFQLAHYFLDDYVDFAAAKTPDFLLAKLGNNTPFTFYVEGSFAPKDVFEWGEARKIDLLNAAVELYNAELSYDNYAITFTTRAGGNYGAEVRYGKNLPGLQRTSHSMERVTRLYGYGKNGLTIEGYAGHTKKYIDSQYFDPAHPYEGRADFPEASTQAQLLAEMQRYLATVELPKLSYEIDFVQLEKVDPSFTPESIRGVGDTVTVYDELLGYAFDARVHEYERYPFEPRRARVVLANFREFKVADYIFQATVGSKKAIQYTSENAVLKGVKYDDSLTLVDGFGLKVTDSAGNERVRLGQYGAGKYGLWVNSGAIEIYGGLPDSQVASATKWNGRTTLITDTGVYTGTVRATQIIVGAAGEKITDDLIGSSGKWNGRTTLITDSGIYTGTVRATQIIVGPAGEKIDDNLLVSGTKWNNRTTLITDSGIYTGKIVANQIEADTLSAISANLGSITAGSINGVTITGSIIQTAYTGQRIVLDTSGFQAYDNLGVKRIDIQSIPGLGYSQLQFRGQNGTIYGVVSAVNGEFNVASGNGGDLFLDSQGGGGIYIAAPFVNFQFKEIRNLNLSTSNISGLDSRLNDIDSDISSLNTQVNSLSSNKAEKSEAGYSIAFDPGTRNLKLYNRYGLVISQTTIP